MVTRIKIGITGSKGYIGNSFLSRISPDKYDHYLISSRLDNLEALKSELKEIPQLDVVVHFAGSFNGGKEELWKKNVLATKNLVQSLSPSRTKIIYTSSGSVYGNTPNSGSIESDECEPIDEYGQVKFLAEDVIKEYGNFLILRIPSVYGGSNRKGVIFNWLKSLHEHGEIHINTSNRIVRSFVNIDDLLQVIIELIDKGEEGIYNVSEDFAYSLDELGAFIVENRSDVIVREIMSENKLVVMVLRNDSLKKVIDYKFQCVKDYIAKMLESEK